MLLWYELILNLPMHCSLRHWTRREESDFYRIVSTFGVERDPETGQFIWDKFRLLAKLERKLDNMLTEYFRAFYHMCMKVCRRFSSEDEGSYFCYLYSALINDDMMLINFNQYSECHCLFGGSWLALLLYNCLFGGGWLALLLWH